MIDTHPKPKIVVGPKRQIGDCFQPSILQAPRNVWLSDEGQDIAEYAVMLAAILVLVIGTVLVVVFGGQHYTLRSYAFEAWLGIGRLSRVLAVASAGYLLWRLRLGRRKPKRPPWNIPHRLDL